MHYSMKRGFTLIEMLVVITIISILGALIMAALGAAQRNAKVRNTEGRMKLIELAVIRYEADFGDYPPSNGDDPVAGAESVLKCLSTTSKGGPYIQAAELKTCDENKNGELEIADDFGKAIYYLHHRDYGNKKPRNGEYRIFSGGPNKTWDEGVKGSDDLMNWKPGQ